MTNRLAQSQSLYLRKHAENPIDWWPGVMKPWKQQGQTTSRFSFRLVTPAATGAQ